MNKLNKAKVEAIMLKVSNAKSDLESASMELDSIQNSLQESFDEKSDNWQESDKGEVAQEEIDRFETIKDTLDEAISAIENACGEADEFE